ncbi:MAG: glycoside hydrolase family 15 protein [Bacteroidales bacterium]|nr:glycoside hydrolase family 15 protein [Bacteroidales bacterium]
MDNLNYGVIGNGRSAALISVNGSIDWCCLPDFDSPSVFGKLLDNEIGGCCAFEVDESYSIHQRYLKRTNILSTVFKNGKDAFEVLDFMPRYKTEDNNYFTPPEIYRYIRVLEGDPVVVVKYQPHLNYALSKTFHSIHDNYIKTYSDDPSYESLFVLFILPFSAIVNGSPVKLSAENFILISYHQKIIDIDLPRVYMEYQRTKVYWLNWVNRSKQYELYNEQIIRSLLVLKLMSYQRTGAILAAVTTSLPETIQETRNWDYRFCWLRDASMTIQTLIDLGHLSSARRFINFIKNIIKTKTDNFQIMYGIRGERELTETFLEHLAGYENSLPVRVGNAAYRQSQHDIYGFLMDVIYQYFRFFSGTLDETEEIWSITKRIARIVTDIWHLPDNGIWEFRGEQKHFVFSKVLCWVAMDRAVKIAELLNKTEYIDTWESAAKTIRKDIHELGWNEEKQSFTQYYGGKEMDASVLQMETYGFIEGTDPRYCKTVAAIKKELYRDGLMYRYRNPDDFGVPTSSFTICTFWLINSLYKTGSIDEARQIFEEILKYSNHVGLYSEDLDFRTKRLLGNFPQAYSHLALIQTARLFSEPKSAVKFIKP